MKELRAEDVWFWVADKQWFRFRFEAEQHGTRIERMTLLDLLRMHWIDEATANDMLAEEQRPLTDAERQSAKGVKVWVVWYEDRFGSGSDRDPATMVSVYPTEELARQDPDWLSRPLDVPNVENWDGYFITTVEVLGLGPDFSPATVRDLLARVK